MLEFVAIFIKLGDSVTKYYMLHRTLSKAQAVGHQVLNFA